VLTEIQVNNFALMDKLRVEFSEKLNVFTGETGAGKSLLIDAIRFVLGERLDSFRFQSNKDNCRVEAVFDLDEYLKTVIPDLDSFLESDDDPLILSREYNSKTGKSRCQINGRTVTASGLKKVSSFLLDIHGQYDHQLLFDSKVHIEILDRFLKDSSMISEYQQLFQKYASLVKRKQELANLADNQERETDLLKYQVEEIAQSGIEQEDEETLEQERLRLANAERLHELVSSLLSALDEKDESASFLLGKVASDLKDLAGIDSSLNSLEQESSSIQIQLDEMVQTLQDYRESIVFDADQLKQVEEKTDTINVIKRKYGPAREEVLTFYNEAREKYDKLINATVFEKEVDEAINQMLPQIKKSASQISQQRKKAAAALKKTIESELRDLGIENAQFDTQFEEVDFELKGNDKLEFMISPNLGQSLQPLSKIVSGGEVSRVMLALKKALCKVDPIPTLIFDEIDANIGGRMGTVTGEKLKEIAQERQVLLITHLPQIASFAQRHFKVKKLVRSGQTFADYQVIEDEARVKELAQMMSGKQESEISRKHAEEMLNRI